MNTADARVFAGDDNDSVKKAVRAVFSAQLTQYLQQVTRPAPLMSNVSASHEHRTAVCFEQQMF